MRFACLVVVMVTTATIFACGGSTESSSSGSGNTSSTSSSGDPTSPGNTSSSGHGFPDCAMSSCNGMPKPSSVCPDGRPSAAECQHDSEATCAWVERCDPGPSCFEKSGRVTPPMAACKTSDDCSVVEITSDCCGTVLVTGVAKDQLTTVTQCAATRKAGYPACGCAQGMTTADDTTTPADGGSARATCIDGRCWSTFNP